MKSDLEKMDLNVAQLYASKCQKNQEDLLAFIKKGGWLTGKLNKEEYEETLSRMRTAGTSCSFAPGKVPLDTPDYAGLVDALSKVNWRCRQ